MTQKEKFLALLSDGQWHDTVELNSIAWRYGARLHDLRNDGNVLEKRKVEGSKIEQWRLVRAAA